MDLGPYIRRSAPPLVLGGMLALVAFFVLRPEAAPAGLDLPETVDFNHHVRPILSQNCYVCHGPDHSTREAGLRLDTYEGATARLAEGGRAIVPGSPRRSRLVHRITAADADERMPPPQTNKVLTPREVALLRRWINQGATYKPHWAFLPPTPHTLPGGPEARPIDRLIRARLAQQGLSPAPPAPPEARLRRLAFTLTGLPPTPDDVRAFAADTSAGAYARWVDHYLASPHFGERWARHWMDLVRYADSRGHEFDFNIQGAWRYRDYLIRAFNADLPYDRFITEHLAGDLLDPPRRHPQEGYNESVIGTLSLALGEAIHSPVDVRQDEADRIDNQIDVTTKTFQALTVNCARCHDHKFDPIPTADYYAFYGIFESTRAAPTALLSSDDHAHLDSLFLIKATVRQHFADAWLDGLTPTPVQTTALDPPPPVPPPPPPTDTLKAQVLGDFRDGGYDGWYPQGPAYGDAPRRGEPRFDGSGHRLLGLTAGMAASTRWPAGLPGALRSPTFTIAHDTLAVRAAGRGTTVRIIIDNFQLIRFPIFGGLDVRLDSPEPTTIKFALPHWQGRKAYIEVLQGVYDKAGVINDNHILTTAPDAWAEVAYAVAYSGEVSDPAALLPPPPTAPAAPDLRAAIVAWARGEADAAAVARINAALQARQLTTTISALKPLLREGEALREQLGDFDYIQGAVAGDRIESPVFERGSYASPGDAPIPHRFLTAIDPDPSAFEATPGSRLALAHALTHPDNPLTARVMVNRLWHHLFGRGLVETVDNFGAQGRLPTHPALLDHLALQFIEEGWSVKAMIREMVLSETFQQGSTPPAAAVAADPQNHLWHHYPVRRLEAEAIRDALLATSGRLDPTLYGPPVPVHLTAFMTGRGRPPATGPLDGDGRRSLYIALRRNFLPPMMLAFDLPIPFSTFGRRNTSNVPAQSLTLLNDPFVAEQAMVWGEALARMAGDADAKLDHAFLAAFSRWPTDEERADGRQFLHDRATTLGLPPDEAHRHAEAWATYAHVVFNMKAFIYLL